MNALSRVPYTGWDLLGEFDHLVNGFFGPTRAGEPINHQLSPAMDIVENETDYVVTTDLPGVKKENLNVNIKDGVLTIEAESNRAEVEKEGEKVIKVERRSGKYRRTLKLGNTIDDSKISADYVDGVLTLKLPKVEEVPSRQIEVAVH